MRTRIALLALSLSAAPAHAQPRVELLFGSARNVESPPAEADGWVGLSVEWPLANGLEVGIGTDHRFEGATPSPAEYEGVGIYLSLRRTFDVGPVTPFLRVGLGAGAAPCEGDTCTDGVHVRGSAGARVPLGRGVDLSAELALSRVGRPFGGIGLSFPLGRRARTR